MTKKFSNVVVMVSSQCIEFLGVIERNYGDSAAGLKGDGIF